LRNSLHMEASIKKQVGERPLAEVTDLILEGCKSEKIEGLTGEFTNLQLLNLSGVGLTSLDGMPSLGNLRSIDLSDNNELTSACLTTLVEKCPRLYHIILCGSDIKEVDELKPLQGMKDLNALDLLDCPVTEVPDYRQKVFSMLSGIKYLDGYDINDAGDSEVDDEDEDLSDEEDNSEDDLDDEGNPDDEFEGEDEEEEEDGDEEDNANGLAYLDSSQAVQDEDESEDYLAEEGATPESAAAGTRGVKRKRAGEENGEGETEEKKQNGGKAKETV